MSSKCMKVQERYIDISKRTGYSVDTVERVLQGRKESIIDDLKNGRGVIDYGICQINPYMQSILSVHGVIKNKPRLKIVASKNLVETLGNIENFTIDEDEGEIGVRVQTLAWQK